MYELSQEKGKEAPHANTQSTSQQDFSVNGHTVNILSFVGHMVSVVTTQLSSGGEEAAVDCGYVTKRTLWTRKFKFHIISTYHNIIFTFVSTI